MAVVRRVEKVNPSGIEALSGLSPLFDPVFDHLLERALSGDTEVYFAAVPRALVRPFDPDYNPSLHPVGVAAISEVNTRWRAGDVSQVWVYPKDDGFIMSDDYIVWEALKEGQPDFVPCWVLGKPNPSTVKDLQGPLEQSAVRRALGFSTEVTSAPAPSGNYEHGIGQVTRDFATLQRQWKAGTIAIGIDRVFARQFYTDIAISEIDRRTGERDLVARFFVFGAFLVAPAALLMSCILAAVGLKWFSAIAIPIAIVTYARYQSSSSSARSRLGAISWIFALSIAVSLFGGPRNRLPSGMISAFLLSLWALRFMYVAAVRSLRSLVLRNARAYAWLQDNVSVQPI